VETTAVSFNAKGNLICSGDKEGNTIIWESWGNMPVRKAFDKTLSGSVKSIAWSNDDKRIVMVGEGK
jgi:WD repeat-containing protein 1 (actin-interacting protein 1)